MKKFIEIDHAADLAFRVFGKTKKNLFENAALALYSLVSDINKVSPREKIAISIQGKDHQDLLVSWLNELNFISQTRHYVFSLFRITSLNRGSLEAEAEGELYDLSKHGIIKEIKSVTFHNNVIRKDEHGYECVIVCDI